MAQTQPQKLFSGLDGALLINKPEGITSFGVIELLQKRLMETYGVKRRDLPKLGHGGTLDPFATGLLVLCVGKAVKLARYFLGSDKTYRGVIRFGETTVPGDPTAPVSESSKVIPESRESIQKLATQLTKQPYLQTPPMHSAKKKNGKALYELARAGLEVEREPKLCHLRQFEITGYEKPRASFEVTCTSGTYIRTLAQDMGRLLGTVAMLDSLDRTVAGHFKLTDACTPERIAEGLSEGSSLAELPCWVPFDRMLSHWAGVEATEDETRALRFGQQQVLFNILKRAPASAETGALAIYSRSHLIAIARREQDTWGLDRVFPSEASE